MRKFFLSLSGQNSVRNASIILIITLTLSNILGLFRDMLLARSFPFSASDPYVSAFRIPDTVFNFLILGAITSAFIPIFSEIIVRGDEKRGHNVASSMLNLGAGLMLLSAVIFYFLMPGIMPHIVFGLSDEKITEAIQFSRFLMLTPVFFSLSYIVGGILNSYGRFFAFSLSPLLYNLSIIAGIIFVAPTYGLAGVVYFVVLGSALHFLIQVPALIRVGFKYRLAIDLRDDALKRIGQLMIPRSLSLGANQIMLTILTSIGSGISAGVISAFYYANNIQTVPTVILGNSFATAVFPTLSKKIAQGDSEGFSFYLVRAMRVIGFLLIPSTVVFVLLRAQIARLVIGLGNASWNDTKMTALALAFFSISFIAQGLIPLLARAFFALKNTRIPMATSMLAVLFSVVAAYPLSHYYSISGLTLAFSMGSFLQFFLLLYQINRIYPHICNRALLISYLRITLVSLVMGGFIWSTMHIMSDFVDMRRYLGVLTQTLVSVAAGVVSFVGLSYLFGFEEMKWALARRVANRNREMAPEQM